MIAITRDKEDCIATQGMMGLQQQQTGLQCKMLLHRICVLCVFSSLLPTMTINPTTTTSITSTHTHPYTHTQTHIHTHTHRHTYIDAQHTFTQQSLTMIKKYIITE
eukprot:GHVQ01017493.1.p2 GENE.GHVQ01017493.1~~GHVQ01017493.1.p2  ORF type:complete len:106 (+),score=26.22 GHVQ01017493.1:365-682(+)